MAGGIGARRTGQRRVVRAATAVLATLVTSSAVAAQTIVPVHKEPRHRLVFDGGQVKMLDVQIQPGDTTLFHTHDSAILYVNLSNATTVSQNLGGELRNSPMSEDAVLITSKTPNTVNASRAGTVSSVTSYVEQPLTHRVANMGPTLFRLFAIANYGPGTDSTTPEANPPGEQLLESRWYRAYRVDLQPGQATEWHRSTTPVVAVQALPGEVEVQGRGNSPASLRVMRQPGEWFYGDAGTEYQIRNRGSGPVTVTVVYAR